MARIKELYLVGPYFTLPMGMDGATARNARRIAGLTALDRSHLVRSTLKCYRDGAVPQSDDMCQ